MRVADKIELAARDRKTLAGLSRRGAPGIAMRAQIVLLAAEGAGNKEIAAELGISEKTVSLWRRRFFERGIEALQEEARTSGKKRGRPSLSPRTVELVLELTRHYTPDDPPHYWTSRAVARETKTSEPSVRRIWRRYGIKPQLGIGTEKASLSWPPVGDDDLDE